MKLSAELDDIILQQGNMRLFFNGTSAQHASSVVQARFQPLDQQQQQQFGIEHVIMLRNGFPPAPRDQIYCLFPNTRNERRRILATHAYGPHWPLFGGGQSGLNIAINEALADSPEQSSHGGSTRFALVYGNNVVGFSQPTVQGTLYMVWAQSVTFYNADKVVVRIANDVPLVVNMNGEALITGIYMLEPKAGAHPLPMVQHDNVRTPIMLGDHAALWVYEKRPERGPAPGALMRVMGYEDAVNWATRPSRNTQEWIALGSNGGGGGSHECCVTGGESDVEDVGEGHRRVANVYDWRSTPDGLFVRESAQMTLSVHGVVIVGERSDGPDARDPFQEYE